MRNVRWFILPLFVFSFLFAKKNSEVDSLFQLLETEKIDSNRVKLLSELCWELRKNDTDKALEYGLLADSLAKAIDFPFGMGKAANNIGIVYWTQGDYPNAIEWLKKSISPYEKIGMKRGLLAAHVNLGMLFTFTAQYDSSVSYLLYALDQAKTQKDSVYLRAILSNLGNTFLKQKEYQKGIIYFEEAIAVAKARKEPGGAASATMGLGICMQNLAQPQKAIEYFRESKRLALGNRNEANLNNAYLNLAAVFQDIEDADSMLFYSRKALELQQSLGFDEIRKTYAYGNIGKALQLKGQFYEAEKYLKLFELIADTSGNLERGMIAHKNLYELYEHWENYPKAFFHLQTYSQLKDSIFKEKKARSIAELEVKYQTAEQERQIIERDLKLAREESTRKRLLLWGAVVLACLILAFSYIFLRSRFLARQRLQEERHRQEALRLQAVIDTQEQERSRIARDLHDGVGQLLASTHLQFCHLQKEESQQWEKSLGLLHEATEEVRRIAHQMLPRSLAEAELPAALEHLVTGTFRNSSLNTTFETLGNPTELPQNTNIGIYRITQELLQNIVKHAEATEVVVQLFFQKKAVQILVEDNGKGLPKDASATSNGMGMKNIRTRVESLGGSLHIESEGSGLLVRVILPRRETGLI